jgi:hypothetical protein
VRCQLHLTRWQQGVDGNLQGNIILLQQKLRTLQGREKEGVGDKENMVTKELRILLDKVDIQWRQRAKLDWLRCGDRNTKF